MSAKLFGKLPSHGDFVARGFTRDERDALDSWLSRSLADARTTLGGKFENAYEQAPPWRFAWSEGDRWTAGAMAASVDAVGRHFPILFAFEDLTGEQVEHAAAQAEGLLYDALAGGWDADWLHAAPAEIAADASWAGGERWWTLGGEGFTERHLKGARPAGLLVAMLTTTAKDSEHA